MPEAVKLYSDEKLVKIGLKRYLHISLPDAATQTYCGLVNSKVDSFAYLKSADSSQSLYSDICKWCLEERRRQNPQAAQEEARPEVILEKWRLGSLDAYAILKAVPKEALLQTIINSKLDKRLALSAEVIYRVLLNN